jgi:hypothetical protein
MNTHLFVIVAPMPLPANKYGIVLANSKIKETIPFSVKDTLAEARVAALALCKFFDCEMVESPSEAIGIVSWNPDGITIQEMTDGNNKLSSEHSHQIPAGQWHPRFQLPEPNYPDSM